jgi:hypothetical protein
MFAPTCVHHHHHLGDPRVLDILGISAIDDISFLLDYLDSRFNSLPGGIFERRSSMFRHCSDDSMSLSS